MKRLLLCGALLLGWPLAQASLYQPCENGLRPCPPPHWYLDLQIGGYQFAAPNFSFGQIPEGGLGVFPIAQFDIPNKDRINGFYPRLALGFEFDNGWCPCYVGDNFFIEIGIFYSCFEKRGEEREVVPGYAFPRLDGSGDFLYSEEDAWLSAINFDREYEYGGVQFQLGSNIFGTKRRFGITPYLELDVNSVNQNYAMRVPHISGQFAATNLRIHEKLKTTYWDVGIGVEFDYYFQPGCRSFFVFGQATGFASHASTRFRGSERVTTVVPSPGTTAPSFIRGDECVFSGKARGQLGIGYLFGENFALSIMGQVDYWGYIPAVENPRRTENGLGGNGVYDGPAHIKKTSTTNYALVLEATVFYF